MDTLKVMETINKILTDLGITEELLYPDALLRKDLQLDSTETVEVSLELKRQLGVSVKLEGRQDMTLAQFCYMVQAAIHVNPEYSATIPKNFG
ncbi:MAG: acyl carrier protein [Nostoc sp. CmiVER01]|uniref:acyl carrier protein n=1 Tax=Nostoc sp. CmiVER01 TaxID=3075384 RepID=UPI003D16210D